MNVSPHCKDVSTNTESGLGLKCQRSQLACLSPTFLFSSLATPRLDKKDFLPSFPQSLILSFIQWINSWSARYIRQLLYTLTANSLWAFSDSTSFLVSRKPLHFASQNPSHPMKQKKKNKKNKNKTDFLWRYNTWTPLHELNWTHFSSFGLQYHLCLTIYLIFNMNISVHMTKKIPSVRALQ